MIRELRQKKKEETEEPMTVHHLPLFNFRVLIVYVVPQWPERVSPTTQKVKRQYEDALQALRNQLDEKTKELALHKVPPYSHPSH